ncbi:hypothetical protein ONZ45_g18430 [Pleurotus djamor]|nr:hypothetical protein ONZ45_g18430 [Pleurotus djamor]
MFNKLSLLGLLSALATTSLSVSVTEIQGSSFRSPLVGQTVRNVTGVVTAKGPAGFWIAGEPSDDIRVSHGLTIYTQNATIIAQVAIGDLISVSGLVAEFRSSSAPNDLSLTEITFPTDINVISQNNPVTPLILGQDRSPPTQHLSGLDDGPDGYLSVPSNSSRLDTTNPALQPNKYGLDFWESLEGRLVTVRKPIALNFENRYGEFWARGAWKATGVNGRGGLSITIGSDGRPDANPEAIIIGRPLDGTKSPVTAIGLEFSDITGIVTYQFGFFSILPLTAPTVVSRPSAVAPVTSLTSPKGRSCIVTVGTYNVLNLTPNSTHLPAIADHIAKYLKNPDILFVQEIQDGSGVTDDGVVSANLTLSTLAKAITAISGVQYNFLEIAPIDKQDGGQPGGNIRQAYLYRPDKLRLVPGSPVGGPLDAVAIKSGSFFFGKPTLNFNPGRIDPTSAAWEASRKPLVAAWETTLGQRLFTVNLHLASKSGSVSTQGDARPFVNQGVDQRTRQVQAVANFVNSLLLRDPLASVVVGGDFNEFVQTRSVFAPLKNVMTEIDAIDGTKPTERYSYVFDQNTQQIDHIFVSPAIALRSPKIEHVHVNTWSPSYSARVSDHDPSVARIRVC